MKRSWAALLASALVSCGLTVGWAQPAAAPSATASAASPPESPAVVALRAEVTKVEALLRGDLDLELEPAVLFPRVDLDDPEQVLVEATELRALLDHAKRASLARAAGAGGERAARPTGVGGAGGGEAKAEPHRLTPILDRPLYRARLALYRAKLRFLAKTAEERADILDRHRERQAAATERERKLQQAQERERLTKAKLREAEEDARQARSEELRRIEEERVRLLGIRLVDNELEQTIIATSRELEELPVQLAAWRRRVEDALVGARASGERTSVEVQDLAERIEYDLQNARILLGVAVDVYAGSRSAVQPIGEDPTADLQNRPAHARIAALRQELETDIPRIRRLEQEVGQKQIEGFIRSVRTLNQLRLDLRPFLPDEQRKPLSGFGAIGREQAERELVQVGVVLRYHGLIVVRWAERLSKGDGWRGLSMGPVAAVLFALLVYWWWTRRADRVLDAWRRREEEEARLRTAAGGERGIQVAALRFLQRIRRPLEWLLLFLGIQLALPRSVAELDEVKLVGLALWWMVGEAFAVDTVHALLSWSRRRGVDPDESELQLRGLRFVGRSVVVFGLGLSLTDQLVGRGTIYDWIVFAAAVAAIPILSVVIRWYQAEIHRRLDELGRKPALIEWAASQDRGLSSFVAAFVGAGFLVGRGSYRLFRRYLGGFDWTRRLLAYWFRRGLTKQEQKSSDFGPSELRPLEDDRRHALDPELPPTEIVPSIADPQVVEVIQRVREPGGGVFAVVGERGAGKSTLLRRIRSQSKATLIHCPHRLDGLVAEIAACMDMPASCSLAELGVAVADAGDDEAILIDDAHHLIRPVIGGLRDFERVLAMARDSSLGGCTWVLGMDRVIWQYFERARGARPLLDDVIKLKPWTEEGIARLLRQRSTTIGLQPEFTKMVQGLRPDADEFDRREALERAESNYYRLIWDYALGNPGVALHFWRDSLAVNAKGGVEVRLFSPPDTGDIESLPDEAVFVLRAVVQLESATVDDIVAATLLSAERVRDALRYALSRGYVEREESRYRVRWAWFRAITNILQRRHLLGAPA